MITFADTFSSEEFLADIFSVDMFKIEIAMESWDEKAWIPTQEFWAKWGFLLDDGSELN
jgi:hypothetical protein